MGLFERLHKTGNTIVLVTHEPDVAAFAYRTIHIATERSKTTFAGGVTRQTAKDPNQIHRGHRTTVRLV